jgi:hypothetical protein
MAGTGRRKPPASWRADDWLAISFLPAILFAIFRYDLSDLFGAIADLDFEAVQAADHVLASDLSFGIDYLFHLATSFIIFHNICVFLSERYRTSVSGPAVLVLVISVPSFVTLDLFLPPHGVLAEYLDDVLIYPAIAVAIANITTAWFAHGHNKIVPMTAGIAMFGLLAANLIGHVALSKPSEALLERQRHWMASAVSEPGPDVADFCRAHAFVCITRGDDGREAPLSADPGPHLSAAVRDNIVAAARKYAILDADIPEGKPFDIRHGALTTAMGIMRYTAFRVNTGDGRTVIAIDALASSGAALWFHTLFGVFVTVIGALLTAIIAVVHRFHGPKVGVA